jgi:hypothetical protein
LLLWFLRKVPRVVGGAGGEETRKVVSGIKGIGYQVWSIVVVVSKESATGSRRRRKRGKYGTCPVNLGAGGARGFSGFRTLTKKDYTGKKIPLR